MVHGGCTQGTGQYWTVLDSVSGELGRHGGKKRAVKRRESKIWRHRHFSPVLGRQREIQGQPGIYIESQGSLSYSEKG